MPQYPYYPPNVDLGVQATLTAAGAGTSYTAQQTSAAANGVMIRLYVSAATGTTPTVLLTLQGYDPASGQYFTVAATTALTVTAGGFYTFTVYPGAATGAAPTLGASFVVPVYWRIAYTIGGTTPAITGTISAMTITP